MFLSREIKVREAFFLLIISLTCKERCVSDENLQKHTSHRKEHLARLRVFDILMWNFQSPPVFISSTALSTHSHIEAHGSSVSEMKRMKRDPLLRLLSSSLGRMRDCVGVRELVHQPSAGRSPGPDLPCSALPGLAAPSSCRPLTYD